MMELESTVIITVTNILSFVTWGFPLLTLTILAYCIEYYTKFEARWKTFLIATILAITYPLEHAYEYWTRGMPVTGHQVIVNTILLIGLLVGGYAAVNLLKFQNIRIGKTKATIEALSIISVLIPLIAYLTGRITAPLIWIMTTYNLAITILILIFLTIGKITQKYIPRYQLLAYTSARLGSMLLIVDPFFINYSLIYGSVPLAHYWFRFMGVLSQSFANLLLILTVIMLILEARARGKHLLPSTENKSAEGKPLKYRLKNGYGYLITEYGSEKSFDIFLDYITHEYYGLVVTRTSPDRIRSEHGVRTTPILWMTKAETDEKTVRPNDLDRLLLIVKDFTNSQKNCITLLQRLDYLITENGFTKTLNFIHDLNDIITPGDSILLVSVDPSTLSTEQLALIRKELEDLSYSETIVLNEPLYEILVYVSTENTKRKMPSFKSVTKKFFITKTTARKRIYELENKGLIRILEQGKFKLLEVTSRGRSLLKGPVGPRGVD